MEEYTEESKAQCGLKAGGAMKVLMVFFSVLVNLSCMGLAYSQSNMDERRNSAVGDYIRIYQNRISEQKNSRCAMYPSCSNYGLQVFADKPFWEALPLLADRLCRCSHDARFYDVTYKPGYQCLLDYPYYKEVPKGLFNGKQILPHVAALKNREGRDSTLVFIHQLINRESYNLALLETEKQLFLHSMSIDTLFYLKLLCYRALDMQEKGVFEYESYYKDSVQGCPKINWQIALMYKDLHNWRDAALVLEENLSDSISNQDMLYNSYVLQAILKAQQAEYKEAGRLFSCASRFDKNARNALQANLSVLKELERQKRKNATLAGVLSIIPGCGYLYTGHKGSALTSFVINSLLGYATYTSIKSKNYGWAGVCGFLSLSFYIGNINGAMRSATRYNQKKREWIMERFEKINSIY